ncbi:MAG: hypothetical protein OQJ76_01820, partial [Rhodospirillales bacterium]|nr:hypothetical protein [Rhodospirillales bacterium]
LYVGIARPAGQDLVANDDDTGGNNTIPGHLSSRAPSAPPTKLLLRMIAGSARLGSITMSRPKAHNVTPVTDQNATPRQDQGNLNGNERQVHAPNARAH